MSRSSVFSSTVIYNFIGNPTHFQTYLSTCMCLHRYKCIIWKILIPSNLKMTSAMTFNILEMNIISCIYHLKAVAFKRWGKWRRNYFCRMNNWEDSKIGYDKYVFMVWCLWTGLWPGELLENSKLREKVSSTLCASWKQLLSNSLNIFISFF